MTLLQDNTTAPEPRVHNRLAEFRQRRGVAAAALAIVDWYLIPPYRSFAIASGSDAAYLAAFVVTALVAAVAVEQAARRRVEAVSSRAEADTVFALADRLARPNPPQVVVEEIHATLSRRSVALLTRRRCAV